MREILHEQMGVIATRQMSADQRRRVHRLVDNEHWQRLTTKTFLSGVAPPTQEQLALAAVLHCGEEAALAGRNALVLHGWRGELRKPFDVVCPTSLRNVPAWIEVRRVTTEPPLMATLPRVTAHDAVLQAAAWARTDREAMYVAISALQQGIAAPQRLAELLEDRPRLNRRAVTASVIQEYAGGSQSLNEIDLGAICQKYGLPAPIRQVAHLDRFGNPRSIDAEFEGPNGIIRVEIEGMHHFAPENWLADLRRNNGLALKGEGIHLRYSSWTIRWEPMEFVNDLRYALTPQPSAGLLHA